MGVPETDSGRMTTHIISQSFTWNPIACLYLTSSANLTYNQLATPASAFVSNSDNNYLNVSLGAGYALGKVTDLYLDGNHYLARDYTDNSDRTLPYGADQRTDDISLTWVRRQTERLIYTVKYTYAMNRDGLAAGSNDYRANLIYGKVQYKF
jgi:predicted porin